jgi:hypothetical protein
MVSPLGRSALWAGCLLALYLLCFFSLTILHVSTGKGRTSMRVATWHPAMPGITNESLVTIVTAGKSHIGIDRAGVK